MPPYESQEITLLLTQIRTLNQQMLEALRLLIDTVKACERQSTSKDDSQKNAR